MLIGGKLWKICLETYANNRVLLYELASYVIQYKHLILGFLGFLEAIQLNVQNFFMKNRDSLRLLKNMK